jgi:hypothetical protein
MEHVGSRHCGNIHVRLRLSKPPQDPNTTNYDGQTEATRLSRRVANWMPATVER